jgi:2'-5' RNA ligase
MPFAIELFFDNKSDMAVQKLGQGLEKEKIPTIFSKLGSTPHVSLAVFEQYDPDRLHYLLKNLASRFSPVPFRLSSLGTFPGGEGVLFLAPVVTSWILEIHRCLHQALDKVIEGNWGYYFPGVWVPHCTLSIHLTAKKLARGMEILRAKGFSVQGHYNRLALIEFNPKARSHAVRLIYSVPFSGKTKEVKSA